MKRFLEIFREKMAPLINRRVEDYALESVKDWLTQKRQERECNDFSKERFQHLAFYDELLEDLEK